MTGPLIFRVSFAFAFLSMAPFCTSQNLPAFNWIKEVDGSGLDQFTGMGTDAQGNIYLAGTTSSPNFPVKSAVQRQLTGQSNCFVTKLDPSGNILYSTYFGGGGERATAMTVDPAGDVYVTGTAGAGFPTTPGTYAPSLPPPSTGQIGPAFLFKLNPDGSVGYSTYFAAAQSPRAVAVDRYGSAWIGGSRPGGLPTTPGAYKTSSPPPPPFYGPPFGYSEGFLTRFEPAASALVFSTYLGANVTGLAVASDDSVYVVVDGYTNRIDATGSSLLGSYTLLGSVEALALAPDGSVYAAGVPTGLQPTAGAFQTTFIFLPSLPTQNGAARSSGAVAKLDSQLENLIAGTYLNGYDGAFITALTLDSAGNVYVGGAGDPPTRTPLQQGFSGGFMSELSGDLTTLLFSSFFGDDYGFTVQGTAAGSNGSIVIAGPDAGNIWVNSLALTPPPPLRIDSIENAASWANGQISPGETILVQDAGFGGNAQLLVDGTPIPVLSVSPTQIAATFPSGFSGNYAVIAVQSGSVASNRLLVSVAPTSPGIFAANGAGYGQGYILNYDGTLNTPSNPAAPGDRITIYATGVGPVSFTHEYAVTQYPVNLFIDETYCAGVAAIMGPVAGFPGDVYQLTVYVPNPAYPFPPLVPVILQINGVSSQNGLTISIGQP
jgi:uncharacterized protein (TIGR03437 family)